MYKLIEALHVDANYLFQDCVKLPKEVNDITLSEYECIKKYRTLDDSGKEHIEYELNREIMRVSELYEKNKLIEEFRNADLISSSFDPGTRIINYYYRLASAGTGQILFDSPPTKRIEIPDIQIYKKADYAIGVNGNSMEPTYKDGDTLLVEMTDRIEIGEIGIFSVNNECFVKKLGYEELISLNPKCENIPLNETAHCMGRVIGKL